MQHFLAVAVEMRLRALAVVADVQLTTAGADIVPSSFLSQALDRPTRQRAESPRRGTSAEAAMSTMDRIVLDTLGKLYEQASGNGNGGC